MPLKFHSLISKVINCFGVLLLVIIFLWVKSNFNVPFPQVVIQHSLLLSIKIFVRFSAAVVLITFLVFLSNKSILSTAQAHQFPSLSVAILLYCFIFFSILFFSNKSQSLSLLALPFITSKIPFSVIM